MISILKQTLKWLDYLEVCKMSLPTATVDPAITALQDAIKAIVLAITPLLTPPPDRYAITLSLTKAQLEKVTAALV